jgi:hypothetical protein
VFGRYCSLVVPHRVWSHTQVWNGIRRLRSVDSTIRASAFVSAPHALEPVGTAQHESAAKTTYECISELGRFARLKVPSRNTVGRQALRQGPRLCRPCVPFPAKGFGVVSRHGLFPC